MVGPSSFEIQHPRGSGCGRFDPAPFGSSGPVPDAAAAAPTEEWPAANGHTGGKRRHGDPTLWRAPGQAVVEKGAMAPKLGASWKPVVDFLGSRMRFVLGGFVRLFQKGSKRDHLLQSYISVYIMFTYAQAHRLSVPRLRQTAIFCF